MLSIGHGWLWFIPISPTAMQAVEQLLGEGRIEGSTVPGQPFVRLTTPDEGAGVHSHQS